MVWNKSSSSYYLIVHFCKLTILRTWRQRMLRSNIQSYTPNGGRTLQIFMLMAYTRLGSCGEQQDKPGSKSCSLRYQPFLLLLFKMSFSHCPWLNSGFDHFFSFWGQGENFLVVTHKSILRALICTALGLPPERQVWTFFVAPILNFVH